MTQPPRILVITGGTGTFATAALPLLLDAYPDTLIRLVSRSEYVQVQRRQAFHSPQLEWYLGDIRDFSRMERIFRHADAVIHAAALKHVDIGEVQGDELVKVNIKGTQTVIRAAIAQHVDQVLLLSSDKAVAPVNLYGATKMVAERLMLQANAIGRTRFNVVRYGNVFGSRGSVLEVFLRAIAEGRPLTITDERMTRFFLEASDAVKLVQKIFRSRSRGVTLIPHLRATSLAQLLQALRIVHGADAVACLPAKGLRPGEKVHETMMLPEECARALPWRGAYLFPAQAGQVALPEGCEGGINFSTYASDTWHDQLPLETLVTWIHRYSQYSLGQETLCLPIS